MGCSRDSTRRNIESVTGIKGIEDHLPCCGGVAENFSRQERESTHTARFGWEIDAGWPKRFSLVQTTRRKPEGSVWVDSAELVEVTSEAELRELIPEPLARAANKARSRLHELDRRWLAASPFCLVATAAADGTCDVSPKGDPAGATLVLDDTTIAIPERPGNRRMDGFLNVLKNPHVGLIYLIPGRGDTLRVNGRARLLRDAPFFDDMVVKGHRPKLALLVEIDEIFHHCSKAFLRSSLWQPETWDSGEVPSRACIAQTLEAPEESMEALERHYGPEYAKKLYA
jgi:PPOX class probable FMN-dependent enzyme